MNWLRPNERRDLTHVSVPIEDQRISVPVRRLAVPVPDGTRTAYRMTSGWWVERRVLISDRLTKRQLSDACKSVGMSPALSWLANALLSD